MLIAITIIGIVFYQSLEVSFIYYYTLQELDNLDVVGKKIRLKGNLISESIIYSNEKSTLCFAITDGENNLYVTYDGVVPENFHHTNEILVEGFFNDFKQFQANKLMLQCPSKYEEESRNGEQ